MKKLFSMVVMFLFVFTLSACNEEADDPIITNPNDDSSLDETPADEDNQLEVTIRIGEETMTHSLPEDYEGTLFDLVNTEYDLTYSESEYGVFIIALEALNPKNGAYISISENGEMAMSGVDQLIVDDGDVFAFEIVWYDTLLQEIDEMITLFLDNHVDQYINDDYIDVNVLSALYLLGLSDEYTSELDVSSMEMFDGSTLDTTAGYFKAVMILDMLSHDVDSLIVDYASNASIGPFGETAYGMMIFQKNDELYPELITVFEQDLVSNTPYSLGLDAGGISLVALASSDFENKQSLIDEYVAWIEEIQLDTGGVKTRDMTWADTTYPGTENASSLAQVIIGLLANGIDPSGESFSVGEANLMSRLLDFKTDTGAFDYLLGDEIDVDLMFSTPQAFLALVMYQEYRTLGTSVHPFHID